MYWGEQWVCAATSDDLVNWTPYVDENQNLIYLVTPREGYFDSMLTECGPPAVKTSDGIILFYNGKNDSGAKADAAYPLNTYAAGQILFSNDNPLQVKARLDKPFFRPMSDFERRGSMLLERCLLKDWCIITPNGFFIMAVPTRWWVWLYTTPHIVRAWATLS